MSYIDHAKRELKALGYKEIENEEGPNKWIQENLFELLDVFSKQGHSGSSAPYLVNLFSKIASFEPLSPLTGEEWEWMEVGDNLWQNIRCAHVFKTNEGAYDIDGRIFRDPNGCCYTNRDSRVAVTFPYTPSSVYIDRKEDGSWENPS